MYCLNSLTSNYLKIDNNITNFSEIDEIIYTSYFNKLGNLKIDIKNCKINKVISYTAENNNKELIEYFIFLGANNFNWVMAYAAENNHRELAEYLKTFT